MHHEVGSLTRITNEPDPVHRRGDDINMLLTNFEYQNILK